MPRRAEDHEFVLSAREGRGPLQRWLYNEIRAAILSGRLRPGTQLPATRDLASQHGISRGTVVAAFEQLAAEGYLATSVGRGTFVEQRLPEEFLTPVVPQRTSLARRPSMSMPTPLRLSKRGHALARTTFPTAARQRLGVAFRSGQPDLAEFPMEVWTRIATRRVRNAQRLRLADGDAQGYRPLREEIARRLGASRGVVCTADDIVIVASVQQALDLAARLLLDPGDMAWVEEPGYPPARFVLEAAGARLVGVRVDRHGVDPDHGNRIGRGARLAVVTPARHAPLGMPLTLERRLTLLRWAAAAQAFVFEDDYDGEYRFGERPLAALKSLDRHDCVIFAGTFSKVLFPALRLAYVVLPKSLTQPFTAAWSLTSRHVPILTQMILHDFLAEGHFGRHVRRMRKLYAERVEALEAAAREHWSGLLELMPYKAGLDVTAVSEDPRLDDIATMTRAAGRGLEVLPLSPWFAATPRSAGLVLGFSCVPREEIAAAAKSLARVLREQLKTQRATSRLPRASS
jgi:GntR family transcriptional regulator/MocR family aminotransferase